MAPEIQPVKPLKDMMKNLKVNPSSEGDGTMATSKDGSPSDAISCISSSGDATSSVKESEVDQEYLTAEQGMYYPESSYCGYYYPGYDTLFGEWDERGYFLVCDGSEMQYPVIQADNGSLLYYMPGFQPGFNPYGSYIPGTMIGVDGQYLGRHPYLSSPVIPQPLTSPGGFPSPVPYGSETVPAWRSDPSIFGDASHGNGFVIAPTNAGSKPNFSSAPSHATKPSPPAKPSTPLTLHVPRSTDPHNQSIKPVNKSAAVLSKGYSHMAKFPSYPNQDKGHLLYQNGPINIKANGQSWVGNEKVRSDFDLLNEQNRGPRTNYIKNTWVPGAELVGSPGSEANGNNNSSTTTIRRDQYNLPGFPTKYEHALFYVIKSYSEDDIHKSIKYSVWASTPNGNKKLDFAYQDAHERRGEKGSKCPVFLFFSVNASGQFCGVAEMIGQVDFNKNMDFWQQDKWNGFFPVKWHFIKDVPNPQFRHILLENNDNKPVTNSRDTQEVKFPQGIEMLNIFKNYSAKTSILDDFGFYESRQKAMQVKRIRQFVPHVEHLQQKADEGVQIRKVGDLDSAISGHISTELTAALKNKEEVQVGDQAKE